jgi:L-threonylcarbamoyladenylate synthase
MTGYGKLSARRNEIGRRHIGTILNINLRRISSDAIHQTATSVKRGDVILYPTETIYGLGCNALNEQAVAKIFQIKGRPETKPLLVLAGNKEMLKSLVAEIPPVALKLMRKFWPGPLTIVFNAKHNLNPLLTAGTGKIGIRIPGNMFCLKLLKEARVPIVSTSANISGVQQDPSIQSLKKIFSEKVELIVDAGDLPLSMPSTVVDVTSELPVVVREGAIAKQKLAVINYNDLNQET